LHISGDVRQARGLAEKRFRDEHTEEF
jgi:hypothetical protein